MCPEIFSKSYTICIRLFNTNTILLRLFQFRHFESKVVSSETRVGSSHVVSSRIKCAKGIVQHRSGLPSAYNFLMDNFFQNKKNLINFFF
jgi:hypothetical protein